MTHYTSLCDEDCRLTLKPVPGAQVWPRRLECWLHGYPTESQGRFTPAFPEFEKSNDYVTEIASPADVIEIGDKEIALY